MNEIKVSCRECGSCNRKGRPSVMRGSMYCDKHIVRHTYAKTGILKWISERFNFITRVRDKMYDKRIKYNEDGTVKSFNQKGFRQDWFFR